MATLTWRGGSGSWSSAIQWSLFRPPQPGDTVLLGTGSPYIVRIDNGGTAQDVAIASGARLDVATKLTLGGTLTVGNGGSLVLDGTLQGGTLDARQGSITGGGTLTGATVLGGLGALPYVSIDAATATATAAANAGTLAANGVLTLAGGFYGGVTFALNPAQYGTSELAVAAGSNVTIGGQATIDLTQDAARYPFPVAGIAAGIVGGGALVNQGSIVANVSNQNGGLLTIAVAAFSNNGHAEFAPLLAPESGSFIVGTQLAHGQPIPVYGPLSWTQALAATIDVTSAHFTNTGSFLVDGGTLDFAGGVALHNSGLIQLTDASGQTVLLGPDRITRVQPVTLPTSLEVGVGITDFVNTGTIAADTIGFDGSVGLAQLGVLHGRLSFGGTLDLGGGTLDASAYGAIAITGTVLDGTIAAGSGALVLDSATLEAVAVAPGGNVQASGSVRLIDPPAGSFATLDAVTTELDLTAGSMSAANIVAGAVGVTDVIAVRLAAQTVGQATLGAASVLTADVAGSTVELGAPGNTVIAQGSIAVEAAALVVAGTIGGAGTLSLAEGAAVTLEAIAAGAQQTLAFGAGPALLSVVGGGRLGLTLAGLHGGIAVDFLSLASAGGAVAGAQVSGGDLIVTAASGQTATVALGSAADGLSFTVGDDGEGGTLVQVACFLRGTLLAVPSGWAAVETLAAGDWVRCASGRIAPVRWVGRTVVDLTRHPCPHLAAPIRIAAGAFEGGQPRRNLFVSREHCLLVDGALVPAERLANGATIARVDGLARVEYWHVELDRHDILLAEGLPAESYLDTGNRGLFVGARAPRPLHPAFAPQPDPAALAVWRALGAAPLRTDAPDSRARLAARAERLGWRRTGDPAASVTVAGRPVPVAATADGLRVKLPGGARDVRLRSRSIVPAESLDGSGDARRLGMAVRRVALGGWPVPDAALARGWHADHGEGWRWTDGDARLTLPTLARPTVLALHLAPAACYWAADKPLPRQRQIG